jgi:hypothetical protein
MLTGLRTETERHGLERMKFFGPAAYFSVGQEDKFSELVTVIEDAAWVEETQPF